MATNFEISPFERLDAPLRQRVEAVLVQRTCARGETILAQAAPFAGLAWLHSGVAMARRLRDDRSVEHAGPIHWGIWGAPAAIGGHHMGELSAVTRCGIGWLPAEAVRTLMDEPAFARLVTEWVGDDFAHSMQTLSALHASRTEDRVMDFLSYVYRGTMRGRRAMATERDLSIAWPFTVGQLADFVSVSRPHLSATLGKLTAEGTLKIDGNRLTIPAIAREIGEAPRG